MDHQSKKLVSIFLREKAKKSEFISKMRNKISTLTKKRWVYFQANAHCLKFNRKTHWDPKESSKDSKHKLRIPPNNTQIKD